MINRNKQIKEEILYSKSLSCLPFEDYAAKEFIKWLGEHPEENVNTVHMRIDQYEKEEYHYGNGGGFDRYLRIYKKRVETDEECKERIKNEEDECMTVYLERLKDLTNTFLKDINIDNADNKLCITFDMKEKVTKTIDEIRNSHIYYNSGTVFDSNEA